MNQSSPGISRVNGVDIMAFPIHRYSANFQPWHSQTEGVLKTKDTFLGLSNIVVHRQSPFIDKILIKGLITGVVWHFSQNIIAMKKIKSAFYLQPGLLTSFQNSPRYILVSVAAKRLYQGWKHERYNYLLSESTWYSEIMDVALYWYKDNL